MEIYLSKKFQCKGSAALQEFLWADYRKGLWDSEYISGLLMKETVKSGMRSLGLQEYRQVAKAFMESHLKYKENAMGLDADAYLDLQTGHGSVMAGNAYAVAKEDHRRVTRDAMHHFHIMSKQWHDLMLGERGKKLCRGESPIEIRESPVPILREREPEREELDMSSIVIPLSSNLIDCITSPEPSLRS